MSRLPGLAATLAVLFLVAGCELFPTGTSPASPSDVTPGVIAGDAIEVTALDGAAPADAQTGLAPLDRPRDAKAAAPLADPPASAAVPAEEPVPAKPRSEAQRACEKTGGTWAGVGKGLLRACVKTTRDSGKQCTRASQCESACLARSGTCAPFKPLLGCNEILQDDGSRVTLCIE